MIVTSNLVFKNEELEDDLKSINVLLCQMLEDSKMSIQQKITMTSEELSNYVPFKQEAYKSLGVTEDNVVVVEFIGNDIEGYYYHITDTFQKQVIKAYPESNKSAFIFINPRLREKVFKLDIFSKMQSITKLPLKRK